MWLLSNARWCDCKVTPLIVGICNGTCEDVDRDNVCDDNGNDDCVGS